MRITLSLNAAKHHPEILSKSSVKIFRKQQPPAPPLKQQPPRNNISNGKQPPSPKDKNTEYRQNLLGIQMLSKCLYEQVFGQNAAPTPINSETIDR